MIFKIFHRCFFREKNSIDFDTVKRLLQEGAILIDVRSRQEYREGNLKGSINIPLFDINSIENEINDKNKVLILYCEYGVRSNKARQILLKKGYVNVYTLAGGLNSI